MDGKVKLRAAVAVALPLLTLLTAGLDATAQTIRGHLLDATTGEPVDLGLVIMLTEDGDSVTHALSDRQGYFSITSPDPGSFVLLGSGLGYEESEAGLFELGMGGEISVEFRLRAKPLPIDEILVELDRDVLEHKLIRTGFVRRYQRSAGGHFVTPYDIEESPARSTEDLLQPVPGVRVQRISDQDRGGTGDALLMESRGRLCKPTVYLDGTRIRYQPETGGTLSSFIPLHQVQAVEVYRTPSEIPMEYDATRTATDGLCGVLVFWTR